MSGAGPLLILVTGLPGAGKTTFARALAEAMNARHLNTDIIRDGLGLRGRYDEQSKGRVYQALGEQVEQALQAGESVAVDGTFYRKSIRAPFQALGDKNRAPVYWIIVEAPEAIIKERVSKKRTYSEADFAVYLKIRDAWEPLEKPYLTLTSGPLEGMVKSALSYLGAQTNTS